MRKLIGRLTLAQRFMLASLVILVVGMAGLALLLLSDRIRQRIHSFVGRHFSRAQHDSVRIWTGFSRRLSNVTDQAGLTSTTSLRLDPETVNLTFDSIPSGLVLSQKGMRAAAETAFRKAILIEPGYASAHNNLAVFYATQRPPLIPLARWHYQKALAAGMAHNADLEKMLDQTGAAENNR